MATVRVQIDIKEETVNDLLELTVKYREAPSFEDLVAEAVYQGTPIVKKIGSRGFYGKLRSQKD